MARSRLGKEGGSLKVPSPPDIHRSDLVWHPLHVIFKLLPATALSNSISVPEGGFEARNNITPCCTPHLRRTISSHPEDSAVHNVISVNGQWRSQGGGAVGGSRPPKASSVIFWACFLHRAVILTDAGMCNTFLGCLCRSSSVSRVVLIVVAFTGRDAGTKQ